MEKILTELELQNKRLDSMFSLLNKEEEEIYKFENSLNQYF